MPGLTAGDLIVDARVGRGPFASMQVRVPGRQASLRWLWVLAAVVVVGLFGPSAVVSSAAAADCASEVTALSVDRASVDVNNPTVVLTISINARICTGYTRGLTFWSDGLRIVSDQGATVGGLHPVWLTAGFSGLGGRVGRLWRVFHIRLV